MIHVASVCTSCYMLLRVVAICCPKFKTGQIFELTTSIISFVPGSPKRSAAMLPVCTALPRLLGPHTREDGYRIQVYKVLGYVQMDATSPNTVESCWPTMLRTFPRSFMGCIFPTMHCSLNIVGSC